MPDSGYVQGYRVPHLVLAILPILQGALQHSADLDAHLYASLGSAERYEMLDGFEALGAVLRDFAPPGLAWHMEVTADADHGTNPRLSYPVALSRYWDTVR